MADNTQLNSGTGGDTVRAAKAELDEYRKLLLQAQEEQDIAFIAAVLASQDDD